MIYELLQGDMMKLHEIRNKHPIGTSQKHLTTMKQYMNQGLSFQQAHNKAEATGAPAFPNQNNRLGEAFHPSILYGYPLAWASMIYVTYRMAAKEKISPLAFMMLGGGFAYFLGRQIDMAGERKQIKAYKNIFNGDLNLYS